MDERRVLIMGAAGRDFHNFLVRFKNDDTATVVAFTAAQIPGIDNRVFPPSMAGERYPNGIPIEPESRLESIIAERDIDEVVFAYSDISHVDVMRAASRVLSSGADFMLLGPESTQVTSRVPVVSVCAVRTGVGKSAITRAVCSSLRERGLDAVAIRHPMPYRDLSRQAVERFETHDDLAGLTIEEREEYEPLVDRGITVFAGVDYGAIVAEAEKEAQVIVWDGGNNDLPFIASDLRIVALDPHRAGHERLYHPGETNFLSADVLVINKVDSAEPSKVEELVASASEFNPDAILVRTRSDIRVEHGERMTGKRVLVVEDGPTVTHGGMPFGAGTLAAQLHGAAEIVDPRSYAKGSLVDVFAANPHLERVLPAMGYSPAQLDDLRASISAVPADLVVIGTPVDLTRILDLDMPTIRVTYEVADEGQPTLDQVVGDWCASQGIC